MLPWRVRLRPRSGVGVTPSSLPSSHSPEQDGRALVALRPDPVSSVPARSAGAHRRSIAEAQPIPSPQDPRRCLVRLQFRARYRAVSASRRAGRAVRQSSAPGVTSRIRRRKDTDTGTRTATAALGLASFANIRSAGALRPSNRSASRGRRSRDLPPSREERAVPPQRLGRSQRACGLRATLASEVGTAAKARTRPRARMGAPALPAVQQNGLPAAQQGREVPNRSVGVRLRVASRSVPQGVPPSARTRPVARLVSGR